MTTHRLPEYKELMRDGVCSLCYADVERKKDKVLTFYGKKETVIVCQSCLPKIEEVIHNG